MISNIFAWKFPPTQKYRLYLTRLQKERENEAKSSFVGVKHSDVTPAPKDPPGSYSLHNSTNIHQSDAVNSSFRIPGNLLPRSLDPSSSHDDDLKSIISEPVMEPKRPPVNLPDSQKTKSSQMGFNHSFQSLESEVNFAAFNSGVSTKSYWGEASDIQFGQEHKPLVHLESGFNKLPLPDPLNHVHADPLPSIPATAERGLPGPSKSKPPCPDYRSNQINHLNPKVSIIDSFPLSSKPDMVHYQRAPEPPIYTCISTLTTEASPLSCAADMESSQINILNLEGGSLSSLASFEDNLQVVQGDYCSDSLELRNIGLSDYGDTVLVNPIHLYDSLRFSSEYPFDPTEYAIIDQAY